MLPRAIRYLLTAAHQAPSADNCQPWRFVWDGESLTLAYDTARVSGAIFSADSPATLLSMGAVLENLKQISRHFASELKWERNKEFPGQSGHYGRLVIGQPDVTPTDLMQNPVFRRHTNRMPYKTTPLPEECFELLEAEAQKSARVIIINTREQIRELARMVKICSEIRFQTRELHEWLARSFRFSRIEIERGDGLDVNTFHLPPGGRLFLRLISDWRRMRILNRIGAFKLMAAVDARPVAAAPSLVAIVAPSDYQQILNAGQLMERAWIRLNMDNIAVQPYYVISDQLHRHARGKVPGRLKEPVAPLSHHLSEMLDLTKNETVHMLFRIGYPVHETVRSRRLPLDSVTTDLSK